MALGQKEIWEFCKSWLKKGSSGFVKKLIIDTKVIFKNKKKKAIKKNSIPLSLGQNQYRF